jgi:branched-chain amino acid aminotransferase
MEVAHDDLGITIVERPIDRSEVYLCDELFLTGTAAQVTVVTQVDHRPVGKGVMGPIGAELRTRFDALVHARDPKYLHYLQGV